MSQIIIFGSSRSFGNTRTAVTDIIGSSNIPIVDLKSLNIAPYDYEYRNRSDDFIPLIERVRHFETIILATQVYWYTMSSIMKVFVDRISDLLDIRKDLGRKLRDKKLFIIASFGTSYPKGFEDAFEQTSEYLGMKYLGASFLYSGTESQEYLKNNLFQMQKARLCLNI
jgi:multimeric flavodoxin WrbA